MDLADRAEQLEQAQRDAAIGRARQAATPAGDSRAECIDCGDDIPEARRRAVPGCTRCVACEQRQERRR